MPSLFYQIQKYFVTNLLWTSDVVRPLPAYFIVSLVYCSIIPGTGILSMFAARAGAKHVFAIDASNVALKARQNIKDNELGNVITSVIPPQSLEIGLTLLPLKSHPGQG